MLEREGRHFEVGCPGCELLERRFNKKIMRKRNKAHGLSIEDCDKLAAQRKLLTRAVLPNEDGYEFYGHGADGWRYNCYIKQDANGLHKIAGEAGYNKIIGWSVKSASINS